MSRGSYGEVAPAVATGEAERLRQQVSRLWAREREALRAVGLEPGARLLEVGCGAGALLGPLTADFAPRLAVGVEIDLENARRAARVAPVVRGDGAALPFADGSFERVLFRFVLRHVRDPAALLAEARRVLVPGGRVIAVDADDGTLALDPEPAAWPALKRALDQSAQRRGGDPFIGRRLRRLLLEAGLGAPRSAMVPVSTDDVAAPQFVEVFLAPAARPIDSQLLDGDAAQRAWAEVRAWSQRPDAFASASGYVASGTKVS